MKRLAFLALLLSACHEVPPLPPIGCPPICIITQTPTPTPQVSASPTETPSVPPSSTPTATRTPSNPPGPSPSVRPLTGGRAVVRIHFGAFVAATPAPDGTQLDTFAAATLCWAEPPDGPRATTPCLELQLKGKGPKPCLEGPGNSPCLRSMEDLGLVARYSANAAHDSAQPDEKEHCGEGINANFRLPIGPGPFVDATVEWSPGFVRVTVLGRAWVATRGTASPGFGLFWPGIPRDRGIGWSRSPWLLSRHGGSAELLSWEAVDPQRVMVPCP